MEKLVITPEILTKEGQATVVLNQPPKEYNYTQIVNHVTLSSEAEQTIVKNGAKEGLTREQALARFAAEILSY